MQYIEKIGLFSNDHSSYVLTMFGSISRSVGKRRGISYWRPMLLFQDSRYTRRIRKLEKRDRNVLLELKHRHDNETSPSEES